MKKIGRLFESYCLEDFQELNKVQAVISITDKINEIIDAVNKEDYVIPIPQIEIK